MSRKKSLLLFSILIFLIFIYFSFLVHKGTFKQIDFDTTVRLQNHISRKFDYPFTLISLLGSAEITMVIWLIIFIFFLFKRAFKTAITLILLPISQLIELYGKLYVFHPSPPLFFYRDSFKFNLPSDYIQTNYSYPSGHATRLTFLAVFLAFYFSSKLKASQKIIVFSISAIFLLIVYVSRIYLGEHWLSDVLGGMMLGVSMGIISGLTISSYRKE